MTKLIMQELKNEFIFQSGVTFMATFSSLNIRPSFVLLRRLPLSLRMEDLMLDAMDVRLPRLMREPLRWKSCPKVRTTTIGRLSLPVAYSCEREDPQRQQQHRQQNIRATTTNKATPPPAAIAIMIPVDSPLLGVGGGAVGADVVGEMVLVDMATVIYK